MNRDDIQVTVVCITYNHEEYIAQALDSFLMQKTNFKYQIFVGEDCGPDRTADIVREYAEKHPDIIVPFIREKNMGAQRNLIDLCNHATSPYIAFCEGDDYWTDEYKLQKQFDFMESNPEVKVCFARAEIAAPEDWFLNKYYKRDSEGRLIFPDCDPVYKNEGTFLKSKSFISFLQAHTSTLFYRWNYDLEIPEWYYDGYIGDWPLFLMHLGDGVAGFIPDIVSVYRRSDVGVYMSDNMDEHFLKTRKENVRLLTNMLEYYEENYPLNYPKIMIENRIKNDVALFIQSALKIDRWDEVVKLFADYEQGGKIALSTFLSFYFDSKRMSSVYTWEGNKIVARDKYFMHGFKYIVKLYMWLKNIFRRVKQNIKEIVVKIAKWIGYWGFALVPKDSNLWAFSGFWKRGYIDNTKYFYEYVCNNEPDIRAVWFTKDDSVYKKLREEAKEVYKMNSVRGAIMMAKASVAVTDHFVMSDYSSIYGFNAKTKVVQLWHGVGFKSMGDGEHILNTDVKGVMYSNDIIIQPDDSFGKSIKKRILYFFKAPYRELFEKYFMFVCPGKERIDMIGKIWNVPPKSYYMAGHPRNIGLYSMPVEEKKAILYAPTYRFNPRKEREMIDLCLQSIPEIQEIMEQVCGEFVIRLHPHTWRNYNTKIMHHIKNYDRIKFDMEKDIYSCLNKYSVVITDYSSIGLDFAMLNKPVVFYTFDYEWFCKFDAGFNLDFEKSIPGVQTFNWADTLENVVEYIKSPEKDSELRKQRCEYFFDSACNGADNSRRISEEIKRRLSI